MTNARLRYNGLRTTLGASLTNSATSVEFLAALTHSAGTQVPTLAGGDFIMLALIDPATGDLDEIVKLTSYNSGSPTVGTIVRAQEGTSGVAHSAGVIVINVPTVADFGQWTAWTPTITSETGTLTTTSATAAYIDDGQTVTYYASLVITTAGTGGGGLRFTTPSNIHADQMDLGGGRENAATGFAVQTIRYAAATAVVLKYDNTSIIASGRTLILSGFYRKG